MVMVDLPFTGRWLVQNSPARRVPSHGTDLLGARYAIDFVAVDERRRTAHGRDWRTLVGTEPAERFLGFGRPVLSPVDGEVVAVHDGEIDHEARRSQVRLLAYSMGQPARYRRGVAAMAGNHVVIAVRGGSVFASIAHLRAGSLRVAPGDRVVAGRPVADCGNSGNSTQPHIHLQLTDGPDMTVARGVPMTFRRFREWPRGEREPRIRDSGIPLEGAVVEPL